MADVTINQLTQGLPAGNNLLPYSTGSSTLAVATSAIFENVGSIINVNGKSNQSLIILTNNAALNTGGNGLRVGLDNNLNAFVNNSKAGSLSFSTTNIERMKIDSSGNIGIGTATPAAKLDVAGDVKATNTPKAWVSFDATRQANGTPVTGNQYLYIRSSYNISGVFRIGSGQYQVYFTNSISGDYCVTGTSEHYRSSNAALVYIDRVPSNGSGPIQTTYCTINTLSYNGAAYDSAAYVSVVIYGA
jgi:hypothetical protein